MSRSAAVLCLLLLVVAVVVVTVAHAARHDDRDEQERPNVFRQAAQGVWDGAEMVLGRDTVRSIVKGSGVARRQLVTAVDACLDFLARVAHDFLEILGYKDMDIWGLLDVKTLLASPGSLLALLVALLVLYQLSFFLLAAACAAAFSLLGPLLAGVVRVLLLGLLAAYLSVKYEAAPEKAVAVMVVAVGLYLYSGSLGRDGSQGRHVDARLRRIDERVSSLSRRLDGIEHRGGGDSAE
ncbi:uncharacterized protein LOC133341770 [Lethenteron reissneri]|uniref:uncharacterized protein LOC133341770 n=1 Tax=Lethenteron reissneri TaxID=7753 RepID=UPI002AB649A6|nr:uncharacterized protein LOC133341770 [Lethenteron reissneri]